MDKSNRSYVIANIRIARCLEAHEDYKRRKAEAEAAYQRLIEARIAMTEYDQKIFGMIVNGDIKEDELHAAYLD